MATDAGEDERRPEGPDAEDFEVPVFPPQFEARHHAAVFPTAGKRIHSSLRGEEKILPESSQDSRRKLHRIRFCYRQQAICERQRICEIPRQATNASSLEFTVQGKCQRLIGKARVDNLYNSLLERRKKEILEFFSEKYVTDRVTFKKERQHFRPSDFPITFLITAESSRKSWRKKSSLFHATSPVIILLFLLFISHRHV
jgi:hypothetical protein